MFLLVDFPPLTSVYLRYTRHAAVAVVSHGYDFYIERSTTEQRRQGAVSLAGAAGGHAVSRLGVDVETLPAQSIVPAHKGNARFTGVLVLHVSRGAGRWERKECSQFSSSTLTCLNPTLSSKMSKLWKSCD